jgi:hypothetical protein
LTHETQGEVRCPPSADRGRYATDASIHQEMPVGVLVPRDATCVLDICRPDCVYRALRGGNSANAWQTVGASGSTTANTCCVLM